MTAAVFFVVARAVFFDRFHGRILAVALIYEVLFNISYMTLRLFTHIEPHPHPPWMIALVAGHGALSLLMFLGLVAFSWLAYRAHTRGENLLARHANWTAAFVVLWTISVVSGEAVFVLEYVAHL